MFKVNSTHVRATYTHEAQICVCSPLLWAVFELRPFPISATPHNSLSCCIIKCHPEHCQGLTCPFPEKWYWTVLNPCTLSVKGVLWRKRRTVTEHRIQARYPLRHGGSWQQRLFWWCVYLDVELREDNTSPRNGCCAVNFRARHFGRQAMSGKSVSTQFMQLSYGKFRIGCQTPLTVFDGLLRANARKFYVSLCFLDDNFQVICFFLLDFVSRATVVAQVTVVCPSINSGFSETAAWIQAKFCV